MYEPAIVIAEKRWKIPLLAPRQNRIVLPALMSLGDCAEKEYELLLDIAYAALTRAHPQITRAEFDHWPIATYELRDALPVVARQTGLMCRAAQPATPGARSPLPDWDAIIAEIVNFLPGTTPDYWEDALTVPRLAALREEWRLHPPPALLLAAFFGYRPKPRDEEAIAELLRLFPSGRLTLN